MTNVPATTEKSFLPVSKVFANSPVEDLGEGIRTALAQLSINQNVFGINHHGTYIGLPPQQARQIEIVIVKSAKTQSKAFWEGGFKGDSRPPNCFSSNSLTPDAQVATPVSKTCATCINDAFITGENGLKQKPCGDHKRLAIVPASDMVNEAFGGPMIFRVPAGSLAALDKYGYELKKFGVPYYAYTTWVTLTIDPQKKVTKLVFEQGRPLTDDEAEIILAMREDEKSGRIVNEALVEYAADAVEGDGAPPAAAVPVQQRKAPPPAAAPVAPRAATPGQPTRSEQKATAAEPRLAPVSQPAKPTTINAAMATPAAPPPSQRVVQAPVQEVEPEATEAAEEELVVEGAVPDEMSELFGDLMNR